MNDVSLLVLDPAARIVQISADCPRAWFGKRLADAVGIPNEVVAAAFDLIHDARTSPTWINRRFVGTYELLVVEAVPLRRRLTDVTALLTRTVELLMEQAKASEVSLKVRAEESMPSHLIVDGEKVAWGVATLVGSALRHLSQKRREDGLVTIRAHFSAEFEEIVVVVHDNGPGIPKERLLGILDPSGAVDSPASALVMLNDVVAAHGGRLTIETSTSREDHGTKIGLHLPANAAL